MTAYKRGEVVLVDFGFSEGVGSKKRPALVISGDEYHTGRREVIVAAITSNVQRVLFGDTIIARWQDAGLLYPSVVTGIIRTIQDGLILRSLGILPPRDFENVRQSLSRALGLSRRS